jgi:regulator of sigma E protease
VSYFLTFIGFAALIILHEAGHFAAAKATGMRVERFSLFFGRTPLRFRRGETEYGIGWLPAGGYVKITGMSPVERLPEQDTLDQATADLQQTHEQLSQARIRRDDEHVAPLEDEEKQLTAKVAELRETIERVMRRAYINQPPWKRIVVILAGPAVNVLIAFVILAIVYTNVAQDTYQNGQPLLRRVQVGAVAKGTPAAGVLKVNDRILVADGIKNPSSSALVAAISRHTCAVQTSGCTARTPVELTVRRDGKDLNLAIRPKYDASAKRMEIGFGLSGYFVTHYLSALGAVGHSFSEMGTVTSETISRIAQIFKAKDRRQLHGIVGVSNVIQQEFSYNATEALSTLALISLSLAIVNLFPFLPLDGGHVFWAVAEKLRGRRIAFSVMEKAGVVGFGLILILFVIGLTNDISHPITIPH